MEWKNGQVCKVKIQAALGGNCRIRAHIPLYSEDTELHEAVGNNPNPYFPVHGIGGKVMIDGPVASLPLKDTYVFDFETAEGGMYELNAGAEHSSE